MQRRKPNKDGVSHTGRQQRVISTSVEDRFRRGTVPIRRNTSPLTLNEGWNVLGWTRDLRIGKCTDICRSITRPQRSYSIIMRLDLEIMQLY